MKKYLLFIQLLYISTQISTVVAQPYNISNDSVNDNSGTLYDSGGPNGNYSNGESFNFTICPTNVESCIIIDFVSLDLKGGTLLEIYDGTGIIASLKKGANPNSFVVYNSCVNIRFTSNSSIVGSGWELTWSTSNDCPPPAPNDCFRSIPVCDNGILNFNSFGPGNDDFASPNNDNACLLQGENQSAWYEIKVGDNPTDGGLLEFVLLPEAGAAEDYDFAIYGPNLTCDNLGSPIRCSYADDSCDFCPETGLRIGANDLSEGATGDGFVEALPVEPGEIYHILIDNFNQSFDGFELTWGTDVILDCSILEDCSLVADVTTNDVTTICTDGSDIQLQALFEFNQDIPSYYWLADPPEAVEFLNDAFIPNPTVIIDSIPEDFNSIIVYTVTIIDGDCSARDNITINVFNIPPPPTTDTLLNYCVGDPIESLKIPLLLEGEISWYNQDPAINPNQQPLANTPFFDTGINSQIPGTYQYWLTETNVICQSEATNIVVNVNPIPDLLNIPEQAICEESFNLADISLIDFNGINLEQVDKQYFNNPNLSPESEIDSIVTESGIYWIMIDYLGCIDSEAVIVKLGDLSIEVQTTGTDCGQDNGTATVFTTDGIPPYSYFWQTDPIQTDATANDLAAGIYNVTVEDGTGCILIEQFAIFSPPPPEVDILSDEILGCIGDTIQLTGETTTEGIETSYYWTGPNGFTSTEQSPQVVISQSEEANQFSLTITVDKCESTPRTIDLFGFPTPIPSILNNSPSCGDAPITLYSEVSISGNGSNIEYHWSDSNGLITMEEDLTIENPIDSTQYSLVVFSGNCWSDTVYTLVRVQAPPEIAVSNSSPVCIGENIQLTTDLNIPNADITYQWTGPNSFNSTEQNPILDNPDEGATYEFTALINGCPSPPITTSIQYHSQPDLPELLPTLYACEQPFDLTNAEAIDANGNELTFTYHNDNGGTVGAQIPDAITSEISNYWAIGSTSNGCTDSSRIVTALYPQPNASFSIDQSEICANQEDFVTVTFTGTTFNSDQALFNWNFDGGIAIPGTGRGPHEVRWNNTEGTKTIRLEVIENGCPSEENIQNLLIVRPLPPPIVNCIESSTNSVTFDWEDIENATNYEISYTINSGTTTSNTISNSDITINNLNPDDEVSIEVRALGGEPCGNSEWATSNCQAQNCPPIELSIIGLANDYCQNASTITLSAEPSGGIFSGSGITDNQFNPAQAGVSNNINISYSYTDPTTGCDYTTNQTVNVYPIPNALFEASNLQICAEGGNTTITYIGTATTAADFTWDFGGGNAIPGTGIGPHIVDWNGNDGTFNISLNLSENGCNATPYNQTIEAFPPITSPLVNCVSTNTNSVGFEWNPIAGITQYQISYYINDVLQDTFNDTQTSLTVDGLTPNDEVRIEVIALDDGPCGNSEIGSSNCIAQECPVIELNFVALQTEFCVGDEAFDLVAEPSGGTFLLEGAEATAIDVANLTEGNYLLEYLFENDNCTYSIDANIDIYPNPDANFSLSATSLCLESEASAIATYEGTTNATATFEWNFGNGVPLTSEGVGPHEINWNETGTQTIGLTVEENGCRSEMIEQSLEIFEPLVSPVVICADVSLSSVRFEWEAIEDAGGYDVSVFINNTPSPIEISSNTFFVVENLNTLDEVRIEVIAIGGDPCGNSPSTSQTCIAQDCPEITPTILDLPSNFCQSDESILLTADPVGGIFSGEGVNENSFDPSILNSGSYTIFYQYTDGNNCVYDTQQIVEIFEPSVFALQIPTIVCKGERLVVTLEGETSNIANLDWGYDLDAATFEELEDGTFGFTWQTSGNQLIDLSIEDVNGCRSEVNGTVDVEELEVSTIGDTSIEEGESIELTSEVSSFFSSIFEYNWTVDGELIECENCPSPIMSPEQLTVYELLVNDENGCTASASVTVDVTEKIIEIEPEPPTSPLVLIPNAFSPNNDGVNDSFEIQAFGIESMVWQVYNRWGERVFLGSEASTEWNGFFKEEVQPIGTYVYTVEVVYEDGSRGLFQGNLTLIR